MYTTVAGILFFASFAMMVREGLWNNLMQLFVITLAGLTAFGVHQPLVTLLDEQTDGEYTYLLDIVVLWFVFSAVTVILKQLSKVASKTRLAFAGPVDQGAGLVVGLIAAYVMTGFTLATLHATPLPRDVLGGGLFHGEKVKAVRSSLDESSAFTKPDVGWLRLCEMMLSGSRLGFNGEDESATDRLRFNAAVYVQQHGRHRSTFEKQPDTLVRRG